MPSKARGQLINPGDTVNLTVQFKNQAGVLTNTDSFPQVSIVSPSGLVLFSPTSSGVMNISAGVYMFQWIVPLAGPYGGYQDIWAGSVNGIRIDQTLSYFVFPSNVDEAPNSDGYVALGDLPGFNYSQSAIININKIMQAVKARLNSSGKTQITDNNGNIQLVDCDIFSVEQLTNFIATSLSDFNQIPYLTYFTFDDSEVLGLFFEVIVEGAVLYALGSRALIERGGEWNITDNGVTATVPSVAELLNSQYSQMYTTHFDKLKYIKNSLRPSPKSLGLLSSSNSSINPIVRNLSRLRARRIF